MSRTVLLFFVVVAISACKARVGDAAESQHESCVPIGVSLGQQVCCECAITCSDAGVRSCGLVGHGPFTSNDQKCECKP